MNYFYYNKLFAAIILFVLTPFEVSSQSEKCANAKPKLLFQSGFEGETKVVPAEKGNHQLNGGDKKLKYSNWSADSKKTR